MSAPSRMSGGRVPPRWPGDRAGSVTMASVPLLLVILVVPLGCSKRTVPDAITSIDNVSLFSPDPHAQPVKGPTASEIAAWIHRSVAESQAYRSQFCFSVWAFSADTNVGESLIVVSHEAYSGEIPYFSILVMTIGNPAIAYRYRIKPEDADEFADWINSFDGTATAHREEAQKGLPSTSLSGAR